MVLISSLHLGKKVHCERCDDQIGAGSALRAHIAAVHKGIRYKCNICGQTFWNKGAIKSSKHDKKSLIIILQKTTGNILFCLCVSKPQMLLMAQQGGFLTKRRAGLGLRVGQRPIRGWVFLKALSTKIQLCKLCLLTRILKKNILRQVNFKI